MSSTLQEIADRLSISTATVSRVLNGKAGVSPNLRRRVLEVATDLNVVTSPAIRNMATDQSLAVAFVIRRLVAATAEDAFYDRMMNGAERELSSRGYHLVSITIDDSAPDSVLLPPNLDKRRLDGLIIVGPELSNRTMTKLTALGLPVVLAANRHPGVEIDSVTSANQEGAYMMTEHLIEHGHQHIVCLSGPKDWSPVGDRVTGYIEAMQQHGLSPRVICRPGYLLPETGYDAMQEALRKYSAATAVFAANDPMAVGAMNAVKEAGRKIPDDVAVAGFDNIYWSENTDPPLTTAYIHKEQIGMLAARRLLEIIHNGPQIPIDVRVKNELVIRQSCGCAAMDHEITQKRG